MTEELPATPPDTIPEVTLRDLFEMDPLKLTDRDLDRIIAELRVDRARYMTTGVGTKSSSKAAAKTKEVDQAAVDLLSDLGL